MDALYTYDTGGEGKVLSVSYPSTSAWNGSGLTQTAGPAYTYSFDAMYRPTGLKDQNNNAIVNNVSDNAANQLLTFNTETRTYNNLNQMTRLTITGTAPLDISYNFTAGTNNGKISSQTDNLSGETVTYQYDSLNRLITASSSQSWGETYGFDAFGNLLSKTGTGGAPSLSQSVNTANNQITTESYDANGNQLAGPLGGVSYDAENRIVGVASAGVQYAYDSRNKRIWRSILSGGNLAQQVYVYGVDGQKIGTYTFTLGQYGQTNTPEMTNSTVLLATFFVHKRIGVFDRLGSAKYNQQNNQAQSFYPYGEDRGTVEPNDALKFATYTRDAATGLDYADQRYYANNFGRFMSADRYRSSASVNDPKGWNRYSYVIGDQVNLYDPTGSWWCDPTIDPVCNPCDPTTALEGDPGDPSEPCGGGGGGVGGGGGPAISCKITVVDSGTPRDGQNLVGLTTYSPTKNKLGPYTTVGRLGTPQGFCDAVQIQAQLFGDTNPQDWIASQTKSSYGSVTLAGGSKPITGSTTPTPDGPDIGINRATTGRLDWLDEPGLPITQFGQPVTSMDITQVFVSTLTNLINGATCSVIWQVTINATKVGNKWDVTTTFQLQ
jgi:RHS repeat-associated protein